MELGLVQKIDIDEEMQQAYLDYAMSVIVSRALPDARDGLKPVHRRILYAMYDMGLRADSTFKKSARIVGEVMGKYHPHGDMTVYDAMARMAQDFSMRCVLVDGQGNFGSMDGDPPAAMRYTEARLTSAAIEMLRDITKDTVDFDTNFDDTLSEPTVLPAAIPNMLVNGATGIAVGMSTSIPPHNLGEVVDALKYMLSNWAKLDDIGLEDLMHFIQGPDFPTGGLILQDGSEDALATAYGSGRGRMTVQARAHLEEMERGRNRIIVTELPYMTNKSSLIERIATLVRDERVEGIADLRDESDRQGMRIVIELVKTANPEDVLRDLYKYTPMQSTFSLIMLALVDGEPRLLTLKQALRVYLDHRLEIIRRRSEHDLRRAKQRAHILEGLRVALKNLDAVISLIRNAPDADTARSRLMRRFKLSEAQAQAILDMQLRRLASLERKKVELEYKETLELIKELEGLLRSPRKMRQTVADELDEVKSAYGDRRRTQIVHLKEGEEGQSFLTATDLLPESTVWVMASGDGLVARTLEDKLPRQSGYEAPAQVLRVNTRDTLYFVTEDGTTAALPLHAVPEAEKPSEGTPFHKISPLGQNDRLVAMFTLPPKEERAEGWYLMTVSRQGMVKKSEIGELPGPAANTFLVARVNEGDRLGWVQFTDGNSEIMLITASGMAIRFDEDSVRPMGLVAAGVIGMKLAEGDEVVGVATLPNRGEVFMIASDGNAKRVKANQFPTQGRYGQGVVAWKLVGDVKVVGMTIGKGTQRVTLHLDKLAPKVARLDEAPIQGRPARGKNIQDLREDDQVVMLTVPWDSARLVKEAKSSSGRAGGSSRGGQRTRKPTSGTTKKRTTTRKTSPRKTGTTSTTKGTTSRRSRTASKSGTEAGSPASKKSTTSTTRRRRTTSKPTTKTESSSAPKTTASTEAPKSKTRSRKTTPEAGTESEIKVTRRATKGTTQRASKGQTRSASTRSKTGTSQKTTRQPRSGSTTSSRPAAKRSQAKTEAGATSDQKPPEVKAPTGEVKAKTDVGQKSSDPQQLQMGILDDVEVKARPTQSARRTSSATKTAIRPAKGGKIVTRKPSGSKPSRRRTTRKKSGE